MLRLVRRSVALMLVFLLLFGLMLEITSAWAAEATEPDVTVLQNDFIKITVDNGTGRFGIRTVEGQPIRKNDQNVNMLFKGDDPETSFTTFRIDGTDYIFGNPYKFAADFFSEITRPRVVENSNGTKQIETVWSIKGVDIKQILMLYMDGADKLNAGNVNIRYEVVNRSGVEVKLGTRILLDTMVGANDGPQFQIGTAFRAPLLVERKLVHDPENDPAISEEDRPLYKLPSYWVMRDKNDLTNPQATNVIAYGLNNFAEANINIVDEMIVGHWNGMANTKWDYTPNGNLDFTRDTNDFGTADSAVAFYWQPKALTQGMSQSFETVYGLGELIEPDKVFSLRFMDTPLQLGTLPDNSAYENEGLFDIAVEIENLASYGMEHSYITSELSLQSGLSFVKLDEKGQIVRDKNGKVETESYRSKQLEIRKPATPQEAELGIQPTFKPGDTVAVTYKVQAQGKPWPTNKQYMLTARSPETEQKVEGVQDESIKAQYESNKSNFIVLPPVGQAVPTYVYSLSPKELYDSDIKYITANVTNIDAYNTGNETTNPNFDLYIKEKVTGKRYKVPVKTSVVLQPTDDGFTGDMRVSYRGGDEVDAKGNVIKAGLGPELPLGEYQLEIDYKGDTGGDAEIAAMYDITTKQTFKVTDNAATRIREANILAVYKQYVDLSHVTPSVSGELLEKINKAFPGEPFKSGTNLYDMMSVYKNAKAAVSSASKLADPRFKTDEFMDAKNDKAVPAYNYKLFDSEQELAEFFKDNNPNDNIKEREQLVVIRGMVKQIGTGAEQTVVVDTKTEPAIINSAVAYKGKDIVFVRGKLDVFGLGQQLNVPFLDTLFIKGEGSLSVANSGFEFYRGEWTLDFFNGFDKKLGEKLLDSNIFPASQDNEEDSSLNGSLTWAVGTIGDRLNPMRQLMIEHVYFNKHSLFAAPSFSVAGFGLQFNDYILRPGGISFGGRLSMKIVEAEARNVIFNDKGFVGIDASLKFNLDKDLGLIGKGNGASGRIDITHYVQHVDNVANRYGIQFNAELKNIASIQAELSFKQVPDGRVLPDVIGFGTTLPKPGIPIAAATSLTAVRGAVRELADTIAGSSKDPFPLVLQAGVTLRFGITPAYHFGKIDLTLKRTGIALRGKLDFSTKDWPDDDDLIPMITKALLEAQWATPWFIRLEAEADVLGWGVVIGKAGIFVGQNLEKNRIDFEGYLGARVQIPNDVPVVGGLPLASVFFGVNNDKVWGSIEILLIKLGITYYWGGGVEFGTSDQQLPDGLVHLLVDDPDRGPRLLVIGQGMQTMATSWIDAEKDRQDITYRSVGDGMKIIDNGTMSVGLGGIAVKNGGRIHEIPMGGVSGNAIIEMEYTDPVMPQFSLKDAQGNVYPVIFDNTNTNPQANAWTQHIKSTESVDKVDHRKAYIIVPQERLSGGTWTLTALSGVETRLLNVPVLPELKSAALAKNHTDANKFTASWTIDNAKPGDKINLYLAKKPVSSTVTTITDEKGNPAQVLDPGDPGFMIAKDLPAGSAVSGRTTSGSYDIDVSRVGMLGDVEDIRGLLQQGEYYLRVEHKSEVAFGTKTSAERFELIDPNAPSAVSDVRIEPAGDGYFSLSFKPAAKKPDQAGLSHSYKIEALQEQGGELAGYDHFGEIEYTEQELEKYWNAASGAYEGIPVGGWSAVSSSNEVDMTKLEGASADPSLPKEYVGLEVGHEYAIGVSSAVRMTKDKDKNENMHYAKRTDSALKLLPIPVKPKLAIDAAILAKGEVPPFIEVTTNKTEQTLELVSDQPDIALEAWYGEQKIGTVSFDNSNGGSRGALRLDQFKTDGTYAVELRAANGRTKDTSVTMLYVTVDTIAPVLYLDEPLTGARTSGGYVTVAGTTTVGADLTVNGTVIKVTENGQFSGQVMVSPDEPTVELAILSRDKAGNENKAIVTVTNDQFQVPVALVFRNVPVMSPGQKNTMRLEPYLRVKDGKDAQGKPKFKDVAVPDKAKQRVAYSLVSGDAVSLGADGSLTALARGSALIQADYRVSDDADSVTLQGWAGVKVEPEAPQTLGSLNATTSPIDKDSSRTKIEVPAPGEMLGYQLVYKVYPAVSSAVRPVLGQNIADWKFVPANGVISVQTGNAIVVAKRTSSDKLAVAASVAIPASVWRPGMIAGGGGGPIGGIGGGGPLSSGPLSGVTVNSGRIRTEKRNDTLVARVTAGDLNAADAGQDIVIATGDTSVKAYSFELEQSVVEQALANQRSIRIEVPNAVLIITPSMLNGMKQDLKIDITPNDEAAISALNGIASDVDSSLLAGGQGVTVKTNLPESDWNTYAAAKLAIPDSIRAEEITAVVLRGPDGEWTTVPWKLNASGETPYIEARLSGEGNLVFLRNTKQFSDVADDFWGKQAIGEASSKLFVLGKGAESFEPESNITRAEYPTLLLRVAGFMNRSAGSSFTDVNSDDWYSRSVAIAARIGIVEGREDGSFDPQATLSRIEAMTMAGRLLDSLGFADSLPAEEVDAILGSFQDAGLIPDWARQPTAMAIKNGIIEGEGDSVNPLAELTRAQAAAIAVRLDRWMAAQTN